MYRPSPSSNIYNKPIGSRKICGVWNTIMIVIIILEILSMCWFYKKNRLSIFEESKDNVQDIHKDININNNIGNNIQITRFIVENDGYGLVKKINTRGIKIQCGENQWTEWVNRKDIRLVDKDSLAIGVGGGINGHIWFGNQLSFEWNAMSESERKIIKIAKQEHEQQQHQQRTNIYLNLDRMDDVVYSKCELLEECIGNFHLSMGPYPSNEIRIPLVDRFDLDGIIVGEDYNYQDIIENYKQSTRLVAWMDSSCANYSPQEKQLYESDKTYNKNHYSTGQRLLDKVEFVGRLSEFIRIDSYGTCINNLYRKNSEQGKDNNNNIGVLDLNDDFQVMETLKTYRFYLLLSDNTCPHQIPGYPIPTRLVQCLIAGVVPIISTNNYKSITNLLPQNSYIDIDQFHTIEALGRFLITQSLNPKEYSKYFKWRDFTNNDYNAINEYANWIGQYQYHTQFNIPCLLHNYITDHYNNINNQNNTNNNQNDNNNGLPLLKARNHANDCVNPYLKYLDQYHGQKMTITN